MCTVVVDREPGAPVRILALRDEFTERAFDLPGEWWPQHPGLVGGRDRTAGGTWCASDIASGRTALVVNRVERFTGTPSRGVLPLAAATRGADWTAVVDWTGMASCNVILAGPDGVTVWVWDATELRTLSLGTGRHLITSTGVDAGDPKTVRFAPEFARHPALDVVTATEPAADPSALVVRREHDGRTYATVFGQLITAAPGALTVAYSATPWVAGTWVEQHWGAPG